MSISFKRIEILFVIVFQFFLFSTSQAQMRQLFLDQYQPDNQIFKLSFYSPSQGFVAFRDWVGFTTDSGRTFTKKYITSGNVNYNSYNVNLTFGFQINGLKAFNQNNIIVYGNYGNVPAILYSNDGGNTYNLVFHSIYNDYYISVNTGITDMAFPQNGLVGYAVDMDRVLKTTNGGITWSVSRLDPNSFFNYLESVDNNTVFAFCTEFNNNKLLKTTDGNSWQSVTRPSITNGRMVYTHFLTANKGWIGMRDGNNHIYFFTTTDGGNIWMQQNATDITGFGGFKMKFVNDSTGYALGGQNTVYKTSNGGSIWEPLSRDNNYVYLGYTHNDLQILNGNQIWAGGGHGFLELGTNSGGTPLPKAYFTLDSLVVPGTVTLNNYSRRNYQYTWLLNGSLLSNGYNASYTHLLNRSFDTIKLIVDNGLLRDTSTLIQSFWVPSPPVPTISSISPTSSYSGATIIINGANFSGASSVKFGGTDAASFTIVSATQIKAIVGSGSSGAVSVTTPFGTASISGFVSLTPVITSFSPTSGAYNSVIKIRGKSLSGSSINIQFGGYSAKSKTIVGDTLINAVLGYAVSGNVTVSNGVYGTASMPGFTYLSPPVISSFSPSSAKQGDTVTIIGTGFSGVTSVKFGGVTATYFSVISTTTIKAVVGAAHSGYVTVYSNSFTPTKDGFVYLSPIISSFSPIIGGPGTILEIRGLNLNNITNIQVDGVSVSSFAMNTEESISAVLGVGNGDGSGNVTVTTTMGVTYKTGFQMTTAPVIYSFEPKASPAGSIINIIGANFNSSSSGNIVYFGAVKGIVNNATSNILTVTVPAGATYQPITVISNGLSASSNLPFLLTSNKWEITRNTFAEKEKYALQNNAEGLVAADLDNDGKADLITKSGNIVSIFRNTSVRHNITFSSRRDIAILDGISGYSDMIAFSDINGDGKLDILLSTTSGLAILRNTSARPGDISFDTPYYHTSVTSSYVGRILAKDLDGDGKPDLVLMTSNGIEIVKNTSLLSFIHFEAGFRLNNLNINNLYPMDIAATDLNADGRTDIVVSKDYYGNNGSIAYFINKSALNNIVFDGPVNIGVAGVFPSLEIANLDNDNIPDIFSTINAYYYSTTNSLNTSSAVILYNNNLVIDSNIITTAQSIPTAPYPGRLSVGSLNGDDKPDMFVSCRTGRDGQTLLMNGSTNNRITFTGYDFDKDPSSASGVVLADLDGDGTTDIATANADSAFINIFRNKSGDPVYVCQGGSTSFISNISGVNYQWQKSTDGIHYSNITASANFTGVNHNTIFISSINNDIINAWYRCMVDGNASQTFQIGIKNKWTGAINNLWENPGNWSCGSIPDKSTDVLIDSGIVQIYSNDTIRSVTIKSNANVVLNSGFQMTLSGDNLTDYFLVNTKVVTSVTNNSAISGGVVSNNMANISILNKGIVWSTTSEPTLHVDSSTNEGSGSGSFTSSITGLLPNTTYYVRAYVSTQNGTAYGEQIMFTTNGLPWLYTRNVTSIGYYTAVSGGNINSDGGSAVIAAGVVWSVNSNPTIALPTKTIQNASTGLFTSNISSLLPDQTYYIRAYATNSVGTAYGNEYTFTTTDSQANQTVSVCNQIWMKKNLSVSRYRNGDIIPHVTDPAQWSALTTGAWRWYNDDSATYAATYGKLYNWYAVTDIRGLAPEGWHIPTEAEFTILKDCVDNNTGYLKEVGTAHWQAPNSGANNISGFTALPGGYLSGSNMVQIGMNGYWWSKSSYSTQLSWCRKIGYDTSTYFGSYLNDKTNGLSVRCIQD